MDARAVKSKKMELSDIGRQIANMKDDFALAFDQIKNITLLISSHPQWKEDVAVLHYRKLIVATLKNRDVERKKEFIVNFCRPWRALLESFKSSVVESDLGFLISNRIVISAGKTKNAQLPISDVYNLFLKKDEDKLATLEAYMYHVFMHLLDEKKESKDRELLKAICSEYEVEEDVAASQAVSSIVKTVRGSMANMQGGEPTVEMIAPMVQAIIGNSDMQTSMSALAQGLMSGTMDIPSLVQTVKASMEANQQEETSKTAVETLPELEADTNSDE